MVGLIRRGIECIVCTWQGNACVELHHTALAPPYTPSSCLLIMRACLPTQPHPPDPTRPKTVKAVAKELVTDAARVARHPVWLLMLAGYTLHGAVIGAFPFWGPKAGKEIYNMKGTSADLVFWGGVTVITGIAGGLSGDSLLDWMGATLRNANLICALANWGGLVLVLCAFLAAKSFAVFIRCCLRSESCCYSACRWEGAWQGVYGVLASVGALWL